jgi:hypothetical protein
MDLLFLDIMIAKTSLQIKSMSYRATKYYRLSPSTGYTANVMRFLSTRCVRWVRAPFAVLDLKMSFAALLLYLFSRDGTRHRQLGLNQGSNIWTSRGGRWQRMGVGK